MGIKKNAVATKLFLVFAILGLILLSGCAAPANHDAQWAAVIKNFGGRAQKVNGFMEGTLNSPDSERKFSAPEGEVTLATKGFGGASAMVLAVDGKAVSGFPVIDSGSSFEAEVIYVGSIDDGLEEYVGIGIGGLPVLYFAADYAYNYDKYAALEGKEAECLLWGIGYNMREIELPETKPATAGEYWVGKGFTMLFSVDGRPGDYDFTGVVRGVKEVKAFGSDAFILDTKIVETLDGVEIVIPILVLKSNFEGTPQVDDGVEGTFWLGGKLAD
ncbi:MAG: hypothetical protein ABH854_01180 [Candidatus Diapherotrites archaeon]|nr:hypothetical protein [Candidatus Micrarchaeota archaeon]MBU1940001.1 hypothetical protein [Candidatus Micrarchaeota archaeon]